MAVGMGTLAGFMVGAAVLQFLSNWWARGKTGMEMGAALGRSEEMAKALATSRKTMLEAIERARKEERTERKERTAQTAKLAAEMGVQQREETRQAAYEQYKLQDVMDIFTQLGTRRGMLPPSERGTPSESFASMLQSLGAGLGAPVGPPGLSGLAPPAPSGLGGPESPGGGLEGVDIQQILNSMPAGVAEGLPLLSMAPESPVSQELIRRVLSGPRLDEMLTMTGQSRHSLGLPTTADRILV